MQGEWVEDPDQLIRIKADFIISAFGSELGSGEVVDALSPLKFNKYGSPVVDVETMASSEAGVFCGGDIAGVANVRAESAAFGLSPIYWQLFSDDGRVCERRKAGSLAHPQVSSESARHPDLTSA